MWRASISWLSDGDQASGITWVPFGRIAGTRPAPPYFTSQSALAWSATSWVSVACGVMIATLGTAEPAKVDRS